MSLESGIETLPLQILYIKQPRRAWVKPTHQITVINRTVDKLIIVLFSQQGRTFFIQMHNGTRASEIQVVVDVRNACLSVGGGGLMDLATCSMMHPIPIGLSSPRADHLPATSKKYSCHLGIQTQTS